MRAVGSVAMLAALLATSSARSQPPEPDPVPEQAPEPEVPDPEPAPPPAQQPAAPPAAAAPPAPPAAAPAPAQEDETPRLDFTGDVAASFAFKVRPEALPIDRLTYGFGADAGLVFAATPLRYWHAVLDVRFNAKEIEYIESIEFEDTDGDGRPDVQRRQAQNAVIGGAEINEATVRFQPHDAFGVKGGILRIPFTLANQSPEAGKMFPTRAPPSEVFVSGSDKGALILTQPFQRRFEASAGVFNGDSLGMPVSGLESRGPVFAARADVNPFGEFPAWEGDPQRGPFRLGVGFGVLYRPALLYEPSSGVEAASANDVRTCASLRLAVAGLYLGVEYLHRQQTDSISSRPRIADGGYAQASFFVPITKNFAFSPIARLGVTAEDLAFDPRTVGWTDLGISLFPRADAPRPDSLKVTLNYIGERRFTEGEDAHGASVSTQLRF